jgi:hypothetical protein
MQDDWGALVAIEAGLILGLTLLFFGYQLYSLKKLREAREAKERAEAEAAEQPSEQSADKTPD